MKNRRNRFEDEGEQDVEIILTPLIDTLLVLLVIFIVATPAASYFVSINLPNGTFNTQKSKEESLCFAIDQYWAIFNQSKKKITQKEMEEAAKKGIPVMVLDRPNPINGVVIDGPMLEEKWRSMVGYVNVPYCHGMTVGELSTYFNEEHKIGCDLHVVPMKGWYRTMSFSDTGLAWIPTSPNIPEATTPLYYPTTGLIGELHFMNIGIGYTLPFKVVGAPWIDAKKFAEKLNAQKFPGVYFEPFYYRPFFGRFSQEDCQGVLIIVSNPRIYQPVSTQYLLIGMLKGLYPTQFREALDEFKPRKEMFCKVNGTEEIYRLVTQEKNIVWKLKGVHEKEREEFKRLRKKYLIPAYSED